MAKNPGAAASNLEPWRNRDRKIVMVTGASSGLGREFCLNLVKAGCKIIAAACRVDKLKSLCDQINQSAKVDASSTAPTRAVAVELDVTADGHTIEKAVGKAWAVFGHIDALINNAGIRGNGRMSIELSDEEWERVVRTNLTGSWLVAKHTALRMRDTGRGGSIINISSISALNRPQMPGGVAYSSSKAGLDAMTKHMALELGKFNIRMNSIAPGIFRSEITENLFKKDWLKNVALRTIPSQAFGKTDPELTSLVRQLIHDSSSYVSGNVLIVDGGYTLPGPPIFSSL